MAVEIRRLLLDIDEFRKICAAGVAAGDATAPKGTVMSLDIIREAPFEIIMHIQTAEGQQIPYKYDKVHVISALIGFCMKKGIPVSKSAKKAIKRTDKGLAFDMVLHSDI